MTPWQMRTKGLMQWAAEELDGPSIRRGILVVVPIIALAGVTNDMAWLRVALVAMSAFIAASRAQLGRVHRSVAGTTLTALVRAGLRRLQCRDDQVGGMGRQSSVTR